MTASTAKKPASAESVSRRDLDLVHLARQTAGDRALEREVLGLFRDQTVRLLAALSAAARGDQPARDAAHTLKGAASGVGAFRVANEAARVETAEPEHFAAAVGDLARAVDDAQELIDSLLAGH